APLLTGTTFAKDQVIDVLNGTPFIAHEYGGGRSLRHIVDRARGAAGTTPSPIPLDQAIVIAEKVALSLATTADLRYMGNRLTHGALVPQFIWIADDGEIRVGGQGGSRGEARSPGRRGRRGRRPARPGGGGSARRRGGRGGKAGRGRRPRAGGGGRSPWSGGGAPVGGRNGQRKEHPPDRHRRR